MRERVRSSGREQLAVVVERRPTRPAVSPSQVEQREPDRVPERREHERRVDREPGQQVEVGDPPGLARRPASRPLPRPQGRGPGSERFAISLVELRGRLDSVNCAGVVLPASSFWIEAVIVSYIVGVAQSRYGTIASCVVERRPGVVDLGVEAARRLARRPSSPGAGRCSARTCAASAFVRKSRYVAAASGFFDFELIAHGRPSPPSVRERPPGAAAAGRSRRRCRAPSSGRRSASCR